MTLVFQILIGVVVLVGLITIIMSYKTWHWSQVVLVCSVFLAGVGFLFLAAETFRIHAVLRSDIPQKEAELERLADQSRTLQRGTLEEPGIRGMRHRLQIVTRERGRVWRGVMPVSQVDDEGQLQVEIPSPQPHGLETDSIVFAFEQSDPNVNNPEVGSEYLGEFRVVDTAGPDVTLESTQLLTERTGSRIDNSQGPWVLYETMPQDKHDIFAELSEEELREMIPSESIEEYLRHGTPATPDDPEANVVGLDENDERVEDLQDAVKRLFDRPLRDYAYIFNELEQRRVILQSQIQATIEDNAKLTAALESAERLTEFRNEQKQMLQSDLGNMEQDLQAIEELLDQVQTQLANANDRIEQTLAQNSAYSDQLQEIQLGLMETIDATAPAPGRQGSFEQ